MSEDTVTNNPDPRTILCRVVDVNTAIQNSFVKFTETENKTLEDFAIILRDEMSKIELFAPQIATNSET